MKHLRVILALSFANLLALAVAHADDKAKSKPEDKSCGTAECCSKKQKEGKDCSKEKDGCGAGEECEKDAAKDSAADKGSKNK